MIPASRGGAAWCCSRSSWPGSTWPRRKQSAEASQRRSSKPGTQLPRALWFISKHLDCSKMLFPTPYINFKLKGLGRIIQSLLRNAVQYSIHIQLLGPHNIYHAHRKLNITRELNIIPSTFYDLQFTRDLTLCTLFLLLFLFILNFVPLSFVVTQQRN